MKFDFFGVNRFHLDFFEMGGHFDGVVAFLGVGAEDWRICPLFGKLVRPFQVVLAWLRDLNNSFVYNFQTLPRVFFVISTQQ